MDIAYYFKNLEPTEAIKQYCSEKLTKLQDRFHHIEAVDVRFNLVRQHQVCELTVHADSTVFHVAKQDKDLYASIDLATETLNTQVDKYHKKMDGRTSSRSAADVIPSFTPVAPEEQVTIHVYEAPPKPMTDTEAILQLQNEKFRFHMFHHIEEKRYSLVLPRPDGNYSLISPTKELGQYNEKVVSFREANINEISFSLYPLSILTIPEAIDLLRENNLEYFAFVNEESRRMNILFYEKTGDLALKKPV
ncbi:MAG: ribosome-associated translation inhibitor RaiA [Leptospirales bacterium]